MTESIERLPYLSHFFFKTGILLLQEATTLLIIIEYPLGHKANTTRHLDETLDDSKSAG